MHFFTATVLTFVLARSSIAGYTLEDDYTSDFFGMFDFFTDTDPTHGFVQYVDQSTAQSGGLISTSDGSIYMGVDHTNVASNGRQSVRLTSKKSYNSGLVILDLSHMPGGICGTWPAFWMVGPDWPNNGEIDILEGVNEQSTNAMTLHTGAGCSISNNGAFSGAIQTSNCDVNAEGQGTNEGCQILDSSSQTYGTGFNQNNGGVFATEWTDTAISVYFFPRGSIPDDITNGSPDPSNWGSPRAQFQGGCDIASTFKNQQIVFDTTFCGDWAGDVWSSGSCASKADTCEAFVQNNPSAFAGAHWSINSLKVYQSNGQSGTESSAPSTPSASSIQASIPISSYVASTPTPIASTPQVSTPTKGGSSYGPLPSQTTFVTVTSLVTVPPASTPAVTPSPSYTPGAQPQYTTMSALAWSDFPGWGNSGGISHPAKEKRSKEEKRSREVKVRGRHMRHVMEHRRRSGDHV